MYAEIMLNVRMHTLVLQEVQGRSGLGAALHHAVVWAHESFLGSFAGTEGTQKQKVVIFSKHEGRTQYTPNS